MSTSPFGINWKMTAKTALVQLHHKIKTFEHLTKHLVLVSQDYLFAYMKKEFAFGHLQQARRGDPMHFHSYSLTESHGGAARLELAERLSTDSAGVARCLGLQGEAHVELDEVLRQLETKISAKTLMTMRQPPPTAALPEEATGDES